MKLTEEQKAIIRSDGDIKINAVAGSGKTTTIIEYAKTRPKESRILYLAFNKVVKLEAVKKFNEAGLTNVKVETAHSLAYKNIVREFNYTVRRHDYKSNEIVEILRLEGNGERLTEYIVANHILKFLSYFCNSSAGKVQDIDYRTVVHDTKARTFVTTYYHYIEKQVRLLLKKMNDGEIEITHDFYLKKFQLSNPELRYDYILFDEGQDASPSMLDLFLNQKAIKVIVGDTHQQIYGWRYAVNSLEIANFKAFTLSTSFRFSQDIANLAMQVLERKGDEEIKNKLTISGMGKSQEIKSKATIARTNLGLLLKAIEYVTEKKNVKHIYFEGNINSYTYADEGASLYDVLNLYNGNRFLIKDKLIHAMRDINELEEYIEKTDDKQLNMMIEIVKEYGNEIPSILKSIKDKHVGDEDRHKAEMIFTTVHRCKGMEYDTIQIVNDFLTEEKLKKIKEEAKEGELNLSKLNEEINLLYVAITRSKNSLHIHESLMPVEFPDSAKIHVIKKQPEEVSDIEENSKSSARDKYDKYDKQIPKSYSVKEVRETYTGAYQPWTDALDKELTLMFREGIHLKDMAKHFGRTKSAIYSRIRKLELEELFG